MSLSFLKTRKKISKYFVVSNILLTFAENSEMRKVIVLWCSGNTLDFGSSIRGSNPLGTTSICLLSSTDRTIAF